MSLNTAIKALLTAMSEMPAIQYADASPHQVRAILDTPMEFGEPPQLARIEDIIIPLNGRDLEARLYVPNSTQENLPVTVYFHGGGFVLGTLETHDLTCRALANASNTALISVAYRLAPEHPYPAAALDSYDAVKWIASNAAKLGLDGGRLAVAGDSAGANLAAAACIQARDSGDVKILHQLLIYPVTDAEFDRPSYKRNGTGEYFISTEAMQWFWRHYLSDTPASDAKLATILRHQDLSRLPSATIITAEYDPLLDEGEAFARKLAEADVDVEYACASGMIHGFIGMFQAVPEAIDWIDHAGGALKTHLHAQAEP